MFKFLFYFSVIIIIYTYVLYPIAIYMLSRYKGGDGYSLLANDKLPSITIVVPVFNESSLILRKIKDFRLVNYPAEKICYLFVSDGSTDDSNHILSELEKSDPAVSVVYIKERSGKPNALNEAIKVVKTDLVVFSDVRQTVSRDSIINIVSQLLSDSKIGVVCGELVHQNHEGATSKNVGIYWRYEKWIRHSESDYKSTVGTTGALYICYKDDYTVLDVDTILDDFEIPMNILLKGKYLKISKKSFMYDVAHEDLKKEKTRKIRTLSGNYQSFLRMKWLFSPFRNPVFVQFISHKFLRLIIPYLMVIVFLSNIVIFPDSIGYQIFLVAQVLFYCTVFLTKIFSVFKRNKLMSFCLVFFELNMAVVYALYVYMKNEASVTWSKT